MGYNSVKADWAKLLVRERVAADLNALERRQRDPEIHLPDPGKAILPSLPDNLSRPDPNKPYAPDNLPLDHAFEDVTSRSSQAPILFQKSTESSEELKVCIVGAGVAGLYIAMILESLNIPGLTCDIFEANSRVGGRVYTHYFDKKKKHDYYDVGAMRFPKIPIMKRAFDLFDLLKMPQIEYHMEGNNCPELFNDRFFEEGPDPHHVGHTNCPDYVPDDVVDRVEDILRDAFHPYKEALREDFEQGFRLLRTVDDYSTREFLKRRGPGGNYNFFAIQWMETQNTSTGLFDQAFSESVIDSLDFDYTDGEEAVEWCCIEGGTSLLTDAMEGRLKKTSVQKNMRVDTISIEEGKSEPGNMWIKCAGEQEPREGYCTVFSTTTLGCLGRMDLRGLNLHPAQKDAIRSLHYDDSVKVALQFSRPWWIEQCGINKGGVSSTDLPLRTCVYPSYNLEDKGNAVLLASYTWAQDATRVGSLVKPGNEAELVELIIRNLARLHQESGVGNTEEQQYKYMYDLIKETHTGIHAHSWSQDPTTAGAFALFGPGQFSNLYPYLTRPAADSKFHIVGEASSAHHAWIVGSLESAYAAVYRFLRRFGMMDKINEMEEKWGRVPELDAGLEGVAHLQMLLGGTSVT